MLSTSKNKLQLYRHGDLYHVILSRLYTSNCTGRSSSNNTEKKYCTSLIPVKV